VKSREELLRNTLVVNRRFEGPTDLKEVRRKERKLVRAVLDLTQQHEHIRIGDAVRLGPQRVVDTVPIGRPGDGDEVFLFTPGEKAPPYQQDPLLACAEPQAQVRLAIKVRIEPNLGHAETQPSQQSSDSRDAHAIGVVTLGFSCPSILQAQQQLHRFHLRVRWSLLTSCSILLTLVSCDGGRFIRV
jgi:hypothetical protein